jgi:phosphoglycolate phosphatase
MNVLVDLDGTLTDSAPGIISCARHALTEMGRECPSDAALRHFIGPPLHETFRKILGSDDPAEVDPVIELYRRYFSERGLYENAVYPGIPAALQALKDAGAALFVATSKPLPYAERIIRHFGLDRFFGAVYGSGFDGTLSNKSELIAHILKAELLSPDETSMVGDRSHDVIGAKANGVRPIGVLWGYGSRDELTAAGASVLCEQPATLSRDVRDVQGAAQ